MSNDFLDWIEATKTSKDEARSYFAFPTARLVAGQPKQLRILDNVPVKKQLHYKSIKGQAVVCPEDGCLFCARGDKTDSRSFVNVFERDTNTVKALVFTPRLMTDFRTFLQNQATKSAASHPKEYDIVITRVEKDEKTYYSIARQDKEKPVVSDLYDFNVLLKPMKPSEQMTRQDTRDFTSATKVKDFNDVVNQTLVDQTVNNDSPEVPSLISEDDIPI